MSKITPDQVKKIATLANLAVSPKETKIFAEQFSKTIQVIEELNEVDTKNTEITSQVTGLENITREDKVDKSRILTQKQALSQAKKTHQGYFIVPSVFKND